MRHPGGIRRAYHCLVLAVLVATPNCLRAQDTLEQRIDRLVQPYVDLGMFNGVILVAEGTRVRLQKAYGFAEYGLRVPLTVEHRFRIASLSKQFTNAAVAALIDDGVITPETRVEEYLPGFPRGHEITVRHLVEHTSGIPHTNELEALEHRTRIDLDQMIDLLASQGLDFAPGTEERYSNGGYDVLAAVVERASGSSFEAYLAERVLSPLGLTNTGRLRTYRVVPGLVHGYLPGRRPGTRGEPRFYPSELRIGGGSLYSTAHDVFTLFRATFQRNFASEATSDFLFWDATERYEITGRAPGFVAKVFIDIPNDITVVSLANNYSSLVSWGRRLYQEVLDDGWRTEPLVPVERTITPERAGFYRGRFEGTGDIADVSVDPTGHVIYEDLNNDWSVALIPVGDESWLHPFFDVICRFEGVERAERIVCRSTLERLDEGPTYVRIDGGD